MTAAELLRRLAREPITTFDADTLDRLLPLLAGLVEAVAAMGDPGTLGIYAACVRINEALAALEAAAVKEV